MDDYLFIRIRTALFRTGTGGASGRTMTATSVITIPIVKNVKNVSIVSTLVPLDAIGALRRNP